MLLLSLNKNFQSFCYILGEEIDSAIPMINKLVSAFKEHTVLT